MVTLDSVIAEVRDPKSREYIEHKLPYDLSVKQRDTFLEKIDIDEVENFAKDTGDFVSLSKVDVQVIAMGVRLAKSIGEGHLIRKEPKDLSEFKPAQVKQAYDALSSDSEEESSESDGDKAADSDDEWGEVKASRTERRTQEFKQQKRERWEKRQQKIREQQEAAALAKKETPDEDDEGEWVTQENLYTYINNGDTQTLNLLTDEPKPEETENQPTEKNNENGPKKVIFLTSDFAMQNVIIQMGFILLTMDGMRMTRIKRYKLLCRACFRLNMDVERKFCESCGANTLTKASVFINEDGKVTFFDNPKRKINLRGTIYSIPKAKGGRNNTDLILREDEFLIGEKAHKVKAIARQKRKEEYAIKNTLEGNYWAGGQGYSSGVSALLYENGAKGGFKLGNAQEMKIGYGRKNPNIVRKKL